MHACGMHVACMQWCLHACTHVCKHDCMHTDSICMHAETFCMHAKRFCMHGKHFCMHAVLVTAHIKNMLFVCKENNFKNVPKENH